MAMFGAMSGRLTPLSNGMMAGPGWPGLDQQQQGFGSFPAAPPAMGAGTSPMPQAPMMQPQPSPAVPNQHGSSPWRTIAGIVGDGLLSATGHNAIYAPMMAQARQNEAMMQRQAAQQAVEYQRHMAEKMWDRANPAPTTIGQNAAYLDTQSPGLGQTYLRNYASNGGSQGPATMMVNGQLMARAPGADSVSAPPQPTAEGIARLKANPHEADLFDQQFGQGAAQRYLGSGGAAPTATAPFGR